MVKSIWSPQQIRHPVRNRPLFSFETYFPRMRTLILLLLLIGLCTCGVQENRPSRQTTTTQLVAGARLNLPVTLIKSPLGNSLRQVALQHLGVGDTQLLFPAYDGGLLNRLIA